MNREPSSDDGISDDPLISRRRQTCPSADNRTIPKTPSGQESVQQTKEDIKPSTRSFYRQVHWSQSFPASSSISLELYSTKHQAITIH